MNKLAAALWAIFTLQPTTLFVDNMSVLYLLNNFKRSFLPFAVLARIYVLIQTFPVTVSYVPSEINPADPVSRGRRAC